MQNEIFSRKHLLTLGIVWILIMTLSLFAFLLRPAGRVDIPLEIKKKVVDLEERMGVEREVSVPILMYHHLIPKGTQVGDGDKYNQAILTVEQFQEQMAFLASRGYTTIDFDEYYQWVEEGTKLPEKPIIITFDDGYESNYRYAFPILKRYGFKATIFVIVSRRPDFNPKSYEPRKLTHMSWNQMRAMSLSGLISFHSHTYDLHHFVEVDERGRKDRALVARAYLPDKKRRETEKEHLAKVRKDLELAKKTMEKELGKEVNVISYPFGASSKKVQGIAQELGYTMGVSVVPGYNHKDQRLMALRRINISPQDNLQDLERKLMPF